MKGIRCLAAILAVMFVQVSWTAETDTKKTELRVVKTPIPYETTYEFSRRVGSGRLLTVQKGKPGQIIKTYTVHFKNGKPVSKTLLSTDKIEPVAEVVHMGRAGYQPDRHKFSRGKVLTMTATAYDTSPQTLPGSSGRAANGMRAEYGIVAVDPRVIPLGTLLYVEGYGFAIAADTGGAIKGNKIDLCFNSRAEALRFGRKKVKVHIMRKG